jgi:chromosome segregation ATPase
VLPQDLDPTVVTAMEKLAEERDLAVNQVEEMKRKALEYARIVTEKQALETVALQLAEERDVAMSEVTALKSAVEMMTTRMAGIEQMLEREVGQLKVQNEALETVTLQLAQERDSALQEIAKLQEVVKSQARSETEKHALEEIALQLAQERDNALFELKNLKQMVPNLGPPAMEQDPFIEARVQDAQSHLLGEDVQKDKAEYTFAHIVEDKVHLPPELENLERVVPNLGTEGVPAIKQDPFLEARVQDIRSQFLEEHIQGKKAENALAHIVKDYEVHPPPAAP